MRSLYYLLSFGLCLLLTSSQNTSQSTTLCNTSEQNIEDNQIQQLTISTTSVTQDTCVKYFDLNLQGDQFQDKFIHIEVYFTNSPSNPNFAPILAEKIDEIPVLPNSDLHPSNMQDNGVVIDYNAYVNRKTYANLVLNRQDFSQGSIAYFAVYNPQSDTPIDYQIKVSVSDNFPCPQDCSGNGECDYDQQKCICNVGFFDLDCSVEAILLSQSTSTTKSIGLGKWQYFYTPDDEFTEGYYLTIEKSGVSTLFVLTTFNDPNDFNLVNFDNAQNKFYLFYDKTGKLSIFNGNDANVDGQVLIGVFSREATTITLNLEPQNFDNDQEPVITSTSNSGNTDTKSSTPVYASTSNDDYDDSDPPIIEIVFIAIGIFIALCVCGALLKRAETRRIMRYEAAQRTHATEGRQEPPPNTVLSREDFERYFPKTKYKDIEDPFTHKTCSVCLDDYEGETDCHQLYCKHVFHVECIEAWLAKHDSCPNCKKNMTKSAIEEFFKSQEQAKVAKEDGMQSKKVKEDVSLVISSEKKEPPEVPEGAIAIQIEEGDNPPSQNSILFQENALAPPTQNSILFPIQENGIAPSYDNVAPSQDNLLNFDLENPNANSMEKEKHI